MSEANEPIFRCAKCDAETETAAPDPSDTVCFDCCEDHDYQYDSGAEWALCQWCNAPAPDDYYSEQPGDDLP